MSPRAILVLIAIVVINIFPFDSELDGQSSAHVAFELELLWPTFQQQVILSRHLSKTSCCPSSIGPSDSYHVWRITPPPTENRTQWQHLLALSIKPLQPT
jgi:hypothetical protein